METRGGLPGNFQVSLILGTSRRQDVGNGQLLAPCPLQGKVLESEGPCSGPFICSHAVPQAYPSVGDNLRCVGGGTERFVGHGNRCSQIPTFHTSAKHQVATNGTNDSSFSYSAKLL